MFGLEVSAIGIFLMLLTSVASFLLGRWFSRNWRAKRRAKDVAKAREEQLEIRSLNNARAARARKGKAADLGFMPTGIVRVE